MATWVIHLRVADALRNRWQPLQMLPELPFVVGNLAPDGGVEVSPHVYVPDSATTHWTPTGKKRDIDAEAFCRAYLQNPALTPEQTAFYRGYEAHLRTDVEWIRQILKPLKQKLGIWVFNQRNRFSGCCIRQAQKCVVTAVNQPFPFRSVFPLFRVNLQQSNIVPVCKPV
jgi:hypothetical protein